MKHRIADRLLDPREHPDYARRAGYQVYGKDGQTLSGKWANGMETFHGFHVRGFPNLFVVSTGQSGFSANFPHMLNEQAQHLAYIVRHAVDRQVLADRRLALFLTVKSDKAASCDTVNSALARYVGASARPTHAGIAATP